jgi:hypothetical protein
MRFCRFAYYFAEKCRSKVTEFRFLFEAFSGRNGIPLLNGRVGELKGLTKPGL